MGVGGVFEVWDGGQECIVCTYCSYTNILVFRLNGISVIIQCYNGNKGSVYNLHPKR